MGLFKNFSSQRSSFRGGVGSASGISSNVCRGFPPALCAVGQAAAVGQGDQPSRSPTAPPSRTPAPAQPLQHCTGTAALSLPAGEGGGSKRHSRGRCQAHPFPSAWRSPFQSLKTRKYNLLATWKQEPGGKCGFAGMQRGTPESLHPLRFPSQRGSLSPAPALAGRTHPAPLPASPPALPGVETNTSLWWQFSPVSPQLPPTPAVPWDRGGPRRRNEDTRDILHFGGRCGQDASLG